MSGVEFIEALAWGYLAVAVCAAIVWITYISMRYRQNSAKCTGVATVLTLYFFLSVATNHLGSGPDSPLSIIAPIAALVSASALFGLSMALLKRNSISTNKSE